MPKRKRPNQEPTPWPAYLAEKEQEVLSLRKLVRRYYTLLERWGLDAPERAPIGMGATIQAEWQAVEAEWHDLQREAKKMLGGKEDEETQTEPGPG